MAALLALLDCFDTVVSSDADIETLRQSGHPHLLRRLGALIADIAKETRGTGAGASATPGAIGFAFEAHEQPIAAIGGRGGTPGASTKGGQRTAGDVSAFRSTGHKLAQTVIAPEAAGRSGRRARSRGSAKLPNVDLALFMQRESMNPRCCWRRYALFAGDALCHPPDAGDDAAVI